MFTFIPVVRISPNISSTAGHYGHLLVCVFASWIAQSIGARVVLRIDWSIKTKGSLHGDASEEDIAQRKIGFQKIFWIAKLCNVSEVIDEYGIRHTLDGIKRPQVYRVLNQKEYRVPIVYDYDHETITEERLIKFLEERDFPYCKSDESIDEKLPLIMEYTHVSISTFPKRFLPRLKRLCVKTNTPPRRFHKAYCHLQMDNLLGVTHIVRGNDFHSNRIRNVHEYWINREYEIPLPRFFRVPTLTLDSQKISSSEEDGIVGIYPQSRKDMELMVESVISPKYINRFLPTFDREWFRTLLNTSDPLLDSPIWKDKEIQLPNSFKGK